MANVPLFGLGVGRKSPNVSTQARINVYAEKLAEPDKVPTAFYARPGFAKVNYGSSIPPGAVLSGPVRGMTPTNPGGLAPQKPALWWARGNSLCNITSGTVSPVEAALFGDRYRTTGTPVRMADNGQQVLSVDGTSGLLVDYFNSGSPYYFHPTDTGTLAYFPLGARTVCFLGGRFFFDDQTYPGRFAWSALYDGSSVSALDYATAESSPDPLTGVFEAHGQLLLFGTRTLEFWSLQPTGYQGTQPVSSVQGSTLQWGTEAYDTIRKVGDQVCFVGRNNNGDRKVLLLQGYQAQPISTPDIEADIQADPTPDAATALCMMKAGHTFYVLNLSTKSWAYDLETGNWDIWMSEGSRFAGQWTAPAYGQLWVSDYRDGRVHFMDVNYLTDDGAVMVRELTSRHLFGPDLQRLPVSEIVIDAQTGVGLVSGQGVNPMAMLQWSKDGGHTWGNEIWQSMGALGNYLTRAAWRFLGVSRDWNFRLRITDPVTVAILAANMKVGP